MSCKCLCCGQDCFEHEQLFCSVSCYIPELLDPTYVRFEREYGMLVLMGFERVRASLVACERIYGKRHTSGNLTKRS